MKDRTRTANRRKQRHRRAELQVVGRSQDLQRALALDIQHRLDGLLETRAEHGMPDVGDRLVFRTDREFSRRW